MTLADTREDVTREDTIGDGMTGGDKGLSETEAFYDADYFVYLDFDAAFCLARY